jgi:Mg2+/Co2+ transporter CorB
MLQQRNRVYFMRFLVKISYCVDKDKIKNKLFIKGISKRKDSHMSFVKDKNNNITGMVMLGNMLEEIIAKFSMSTSLFAQSKGKSDKILQKCNFLGIAYAGADCCYDCLLSFTCHEYFQML